MNSMIAGSVAGLSATVPMTAVMGTLFQHLPRSEQYPLPPREITEELVHEAGLEDQLTVNVVSNLTVASHFGYGAACGAVYSATESHLPGSPVTKGMSFGLAVWTVSYLGWLPALGILSPATQHPARRNTLMIAAHLVWGAWLGVTYSKIQNRSGS